MASKTGMRGGRRVVGLWGVGRGGALCFGEAGDYSLANRLKGCCSAFPGYSLVNV